jgi:hypothetical protein
VCALPALTAVRLGNDQQDAYVGHEDVVSALHTIYSSLAKLVKSLHAAKRIDSRRSMQVADEHIVMDPISISSLEPGWRAVVQRGDDSPLVIEPVIAWGIFAMSLVVDETGNVENNGHVITGVTAPTGGGTVGAIFTGLFPGFVWYYLRPGADEPANIDAARAERDRLNALNASGTAQVGTTGENLITGP